MPKERKRARRYLYYVWAALIIPLLLYLISFWGDISQTLSYAWRLLYWLLLGRDQVLPIPNPATLRSIQIMFFTVFFGYSASFVIWLLLMSFQALLPIEKLDEVLETASHQMMYILRSHGPAIFIQDGKMDHSAEELNRPGPGVLVVNFNSAVVLETLVGRASCLMMPMILLNRFIAAVTHAPAPAVSRVAGPGLVFFDAGERIRAVVDLRKQSRGSKGRISGYTRDGIEITSNVFSLFTIGQRPDVIELAYQGDDRRPENLRVVVTRRVGRNLVQVTTQREEELDPADLQEANQYARIPNQRRDGQRYEPVAPIRQEPEFDERRVFNAVYAQARNPQEQVVVWSDLPVQVAADRYRSEMSKINYNDLYRLEDANAASFPLPEIRRRFRVRFRNLGLLSFRVVVHRSLIPLIDGTYNESDLFVSPSMPFTAPQVLRERGIKVLFAGFSSPLPASQEIYQQRLTTWRAAWERETAIKRAEKELDASRIRNHARALAQGDLTRTLMSIFDRGEDSEEIMALRVLQALESVAADPKTQQLLPGETITLMNSLHNWLLPGDKIKENASGLLQSSDNYRPPEEGTDDNGLPPDFIPPDQVPPPPGPASPIPPEA